jgi:hypothetical protein
MSSNLGWEPVRAQRSKWLTNQLKYIFGPRYWGHDGTCNGEPVVLNESEIPYLSGISDGSCDKEIKRDIAILIEGIQKYGAVKIWLEN